MEVLHRDTTKEYWAAADGAFLRRPVEVDKQDVVDAADGVVRTTDGNVFPSDAVRIVDRSPVPPTPAERAAQYFAQSGTVVSPTAEAQRWPVPGTEEFLPAAEAREISLQTRATLGRAVL